MADQVSSEASAEENQTLRDQLHATRTATQEQEGQEPTPEAREAAQKPESTDEAQNGGWLAQQPSEVQAEIRRLRGENAGLRNERNQLRDWRTEREREQMTEAQRLTAERDELKRQLEETRIDSMRSHVAIAKGLPSEAVKWLNGTTKEELEQQADELKAMIGTPAQQRQAPDFGAGARPNGGTRTAEEDFSSTLRRAAGRPV